MSDTCLLYTSERGVAEQIILHVRLVSDLVFCTVEDAPDQLFIGGCTRQLPDGDVYKRQIFTYRLLFFRQYRIILSADTASEVRQMLSQKRR